MNVVAVKLTVNCKLLSICGKANLQGENNLKCS